MRALIIAYSCEPGRGSEPGAGWGVVAAAAGLAECDVLVAPEHLEALRRHPPPGPAVTFTAIPEPRWQPAVRWHRAGRFVAYLAWLRRAAAHARHEHARRPYDVAHHATFAVHWLPSPVVGLGVPSVWGPVGGAATTPRRLWRMLGWRGLIGEAVDFVGVRVGELLPATRRTWRAAGVAVAQNETTARRFGRPAVVWNHAELIEPAAAGPAAGGGKYALWVGALEPRKGPRLAVHALAAAPGVRLVVAGDGPERSAVLRLARRLGVDDRLELRGRVPRTEVAALLAGAACALFTGLREEGGLALAEALAAGTPVVVLDNGGAGTLARAASDPVRVAAIPPGGVASTARRLGEAMARFVADPPARRDPMLSKAAATAKLAAAYRAAREGA